MHFFFTFHRKHQSIVLFQPIFLCEVWYILGTYFISPPSHGKYDTFWVWCNSAQHAANICLQSHSSSHDTKITHSWEEQCNGSQQSIPLQHYRLLYLCLDPLFTDPINMFVLAHLFSLHFWGLTVATGT